jgi:nitroreductase
VLFVHRVEGLAPGLYLVERDAHGAADLVAGLRRRFGATSVENPDGGPGLLFLQGFAPVELHRLARSLHCHQDIASNACLALGLLAPLQTAIEADPAAYRDLYREAGLIGQALYLQAEALGLRGTGIGCFFDDPVHTLLGLDGQAWQTLYHFTIGMAVDDPRIESTPSYPPSRRLCPPPTGTPTP